MTLAEALSEGLMTTFIGLVIVFSVLIILMLVMMLMKTVFYKPEKKEQAVKASEPVTVTEPEKAEVVDEGELIAVLTAAVAACMDKPASNLNIKSYKRIDGKASAWNRAGVRDVIDARF